MSGVNFWEVVTQMKKEEVHEKGEHSAIVDDILMSQSLKLCNQEYELELAEKVKDKNQRSFDKIVSQTLS